MSATASHRYLVGILAMAAWLFCHCAPAAPSSCADLRQTAFVHVGVVRPEVDRLLQDQTILVQCGRIVAVGPASAVKLARAPMTIAVRERTCA